MPREAYVRVSVMAGPVECVTGLECRDDDHLPTLYAAVKATTVAATLDVTEADDDQVIAKAVEARIRHRWPDRFYFLEVGRDPHDCWVQVFVPWSIPRSGR